MATFTPSYGSVGSFNPNIATSSSGDSTYGTLGGSYGVLSYIYGGTGSGFTPLTRSVGSFTTGTDSSVGVLTPVTSSTGSFTPSA